MVFSGSSTNKTDRHDITEILLKVALNTIIPDFAKLSDLSDMTSKIWAKFDKDWHKIGILQ